MTFSLINHNRGYQIRATDLLLSVATGFSGAPYALRHYDLSSGRLGQKFLCAIEIVPILGGIVAVIEMVASTLIGWIAYVIYGGQFLDIPWRATPLSTEQAMEKMHKNARKAIQIHTKLSSAYASVRSGLPSLEELKKTESAPLKLTPHFADHIGPRKSMEDAYFFAEIEQGAVAAVFDGHGGSEVARYACWQFEKRFSSVLKMVEGNVHQAFELLSHQIHQEVAQKSSWNSIGSTAVICYFDLNAHLVYEANIGDSECNIYRNGKSIPLSVPHGFALKGEAKRLETAHGVPGFVEKHLKQGMEPKKIRSRLLEGGVNVSRAIGDVDETGTVERPILIDKPTIAVQKLRRGDKVGLFCDGVKDYVPESETCNLIYHTRKGENPARNVVRHAIEKRNAQDNVTAIVIEVA